MPHESTQQYINGLQYFYKLEKKVEQQTLLKCSPCYSIAGALEGYAKITRNREFDLST